MVLRDNNERRFDIFVRRVLRGLVLAPGMQSRARSLEYTNLIMYIGANEDIFLFKAITSRPADLEDMRQMAETGSLDWDKIVEEANGQPTPWRWIGRLYGRLVELEEETNIITPITKKLQADAEIAAAIEILASKMESGSLTLKEAAAILKEEDHAFVDAVFSRMEEYGIAVREEKIYTLYMAL